MRKKNNNKVINICILVSIIFLIASLFLMLNRNKKVDNHIVTISFQEYQEIINKDEYNIILLTSPTCQHCEDYKPYVNYIADEYSLTIYEVSVTSLEYDDFIEIHDKYSATMYQYNDTNIPIIRTPVTIIVKNGVEVTSTSGNLGYTGFKELLKDNNIVKEK